MRGVLEIKPWVGLGPVKECLGMSFGLHPTFPIS